MNHTRRSFFALAAGAVAVAQDPPKRGMTVLSTRPEDLEMPLSGFVDYITPIEHFYVRTHVYVPTVDINEWRLKVDGHVGTPLSLSMADLKAMPSAELVAVAECAGNGRSFYSPTVPGLQWSNGSVGNGRWRGVRLADVLKRAGIKPGAVDVQFDGADVPIGTMQDFQRAITAKKALDPNTLLAYDMNGQTLPVKHGFPLRVIAPGWASDSWEKWLTSIQVLDKESATFWMKSAYRHPGKPVPPGTAVPLDQMQPVTSLRVKTVIAAPLNPSIPPDQPVTISGVAWSGDQGSVTAVEVSVDGGRTWRLATLGRDQSQFGWRLWQYPWTPRKEAYYTVMARARTATGETQPFDQEWNPSGYGWNVVPRLNILVTKTPPAVAAADTMPPNPPAVVKSVCLTCHQEDVIQQQRLTRAQWVRR
jgi:DMSO/TMAO reductase YedYZ molybdopterin-dependent catalytic subunit